jgi:DNA recombination protein RmuC
MNEIAVLIGTRPVTWGEATLAFAALILVLLLVVTSLLVRTRRERALEAMAAAERAREMDDKVAEVARIQAEMTGRLQTVAEVFGSRQSDFARMVAERMEGLQHRVGQGLEASARNQAENLSKLNERLAVIDAAQKNLTDLTGEVVGLKEVLSNKQTRGAYGQGRMEAIIRDGLPGGAYEFQPTLSNRTRPDCLIRLPGDPRCLVVDAKFPLEGFTLFREAQGDDARTKAAQRVRGDVTTHIKDIADKYFITGETQDIALMFVPAESLYADLQEHFEDVVQRAHRARVVIVSPSLLMLSIQVIQAILKDARMREQAHLIQGEVIRLMEDVSRVDERVRKLQGHFAQSAKDIDDILVSTSKVTKRGQKIEALEFGAQPGGEAGPDIASPAPAKPEPGPRVVDSPRVADSKTGQLRLRVVEGDE